MVSPVNSIANMPLVSKRGNTRGLRMAAPYLAERTAAARRLIDDKAIEISSSDDADSDIADSDDLPTKVRPRRSAARIFESSSDDDAESDAPDSDVNDFIDDSELISDND
jgi:hypothetical protein